MEQNVRDRYKLTDSLAARPQTMTLGILVNPPDIPMNCTNKVRQPLQPLCLQVMPKEYQQLMCITLATCREVRT